MSSTTAAASAGSHDLARIRQADATADLGVIAYETPSEEGLVVEEEIPLEIVRPGTGDSVADGEVGEVVVTAASTSEAGWQPGGAGA